MDVLTVCTCNVMYQSYYHIRVWHGNVLVPGPPVNVMTLYVYVTLAIELGCVSTAFPRVVGTLLGTRGRAV